MPGGPVECEASKAGNPNGTRFLWRRAYHPPWLRFAAKAVGHGNPFAELPMPNLPNSITGASAC
jgi:hypothetical protein